DKGECTGITAKALHGRARTFSLDVHDDHTYFVRLGQRCAWVHNMACGARAAQLLLNKAAGKAAEDDVPQLLKRVTNDEIRRHARFNTPFGDRVIDYAVGP